MKRCLTKRALLLCAGGDGTDTQFQHLASCEYCRGRYIQFARDLDTIEQVLGENPPPHFTSPVFLDVPWRNRWAPLAAAFAATVVLVWGITRVQRVESPDRLSGLIEQEEYLGEDQEGIVQLLQDDEEPLLFAMADQGEFVVPASVGDAPYLEAALNDGWPCEWQGEFFPSTCEFYPISLAFEE